MTVRISGILKNASGVRPNTKIILQAAKTTSNVVIFATDHTIVTDASGAYSFDCNNSTYRVMISQSGFKTESAGIIQVYPDSPPGTIEDFLTNLTPDDLTPEVVKQVEQARNEAVASAAAAKVSETNSASSELSASNDAAQVSRDKQEVESNTSQVATNTQTVTQSAAQVASHATQVAIDAAQVAQDRIYTGNDVFKANRSALDSEASAQRAEAAANLTLLYGGPWTPTGSAEYPDTSAITKSTRFDIDLQRDGTYTFVGGGVGGLPGETVTNGDVITWDLSVPHWVLIKSGTLGALSKSVADTLYLGIAKEAELKDYADNSSKLQSNEGDSQVAGGKIYPQGDIDSKIGDNLNNANILKLTYNGVRRLYKSTSSMSGLITAIGTISEKVSVTVGGTVHTLGLYQISDVVSINNPLFSGSDTERLKLADALVGGNGSVYLPNGTFNISNDGHQYVSDMVGPGVINLVGNHAASFIGTGLNDASISGDNNTSGDIDLIIDIVDSSANPNVFRYSTDAGAHWITENVEIPADSSAVISPLLTETTDVSLGSTGIKVKWGSTTGHVTYDKWKLVVKGKLKAIDTEKLKVSGYEVTEAGDRCLSVAKNGIPSKNAGIELNAFGVDVLSHNTRGFAKNAFGSNVMRNSLYAAYSNGFGTSVMPHVEGILNNAFGTFTFANLVDGEENNSFGGDAGRNLVSGDRNSHFGGESSFHNGTGHENATFGWGAGRGGPETVKNGTDHSFSSSFGVRAGYFSRGQFQTCIGHEALYNSQGSKQTSVGAKSGFVVTGGESCFFGGFAAGNHPDQNPTPTNCFVFGDGAYATGDHAIAIGRGAKAHNGQIVLGNSEMNQGVYHFGNLIPQRGAEQDIGQPAAQYRTMYLSNPTGTTSDGRLKTKLAVISDDVLAAWSEVEWGVFKYLDRIDEKGEQNARKHIGVIAQDVISAFERHGLDAFDYALIRLIEWEDKYTDYPERYTYKENTAPELLSTGSKYVIDKTIPASRVKTTEGGSRYEIVYDEAEALELALMRHETKKLKAEIEALKSRN